MAMTVAQGSHGPVKDEEGDDDHSRCEPFPYHRVVPVSVDIPNMRKYGQTKADDQLQRYQG